MSFSPYLGFAGNTHQAMTFYAGVFGTTDLQIMDYSTAPADQRPPGDIRQVMHSQFSAGPGAPLMAADIPGGMASDAGSTSVFHAAPTLAEASRIFAAQSNDGHVHMPFVPTFWSPGFGGCTDRFGTRWMVTVTDGGQS